MEDFPEIEVSDLSFVHVCNTKVGNGIDKDHLNRSNLLTVSNKYGLIFAASDKKLKVMTTSGLDDQMTRINSIRTSNKMVENDAVTYDLEGEIVHLSLNSSDEYLAVCTSKNGFIFAEVYDIRVMAKDSNQPFSPFQEIKLTSSSNEILVDFSWNPNPDFSKTFVSCSSSGDLSVFEVHPAEVKLVGNLGPSSQGGANTCACWSPKGKQVAVGNGSGKVTLYLPTMTPKNVIQVCPKVKEAYGDVAVMDILWETNQTFFIVYKSKSNDSEQPLLVYLKPDTNNQPTYGFYGDICFGSTGSKYMKYQFNLIRQWNLLLISSATSSEMCLLAKEKDTWYKCDLEHKPEVCSLGNDFEIYCPRGVCFVYCSKFKWTVKVSDEEKTMVSLPAMTMSSDGCISCLQFVTQNPDHQSINVVPRPLLAEGAIIRTPQQPKVLPAHPSAQSPVTPEPTSDKTNFSSFSFPGAQQQANPMSFSGLLQAAALTKDNNNSQVPSNPAGLTFSQSMQKTFTNKATLDLSGGHNAPPSAEPATESRKTLQLGNFAHPAKVNEPLTYKGRFEESTVTSTLPADGNDDPYAQSIADEIKHFSKEVKDVLQRLSTFKIDKNFSTELEKLNSGMKSLLVQKSSLCQELLNLKKESEEQKTETLELFATMERFRVTQERNNDKNYLSLLRQRPLEPTRKSKMAALESALGYVGMEISKVDSILDSNLQECLDAQKRQRFIQPPNLHIIYETLHSNRISICKIKNALSSIKKRVDNDPDLSKNNALNLSQLFTRSCTLISPTKRRKMNERDKEAQLREYLLNRKVVTVRSTAPENLNCSRIVSAVQMREIEGRKNNNQQQQHSQSPRIPITQQQQPQSPKTSVKQQQHQREVVLQPKQLDIQKSLPPAFGHQMKPRVVQNPPTVDVSSAQQVPRTFKMFPPSKGPAEAVPFQSGGVAKCSEQMSILPSITNMTLPSLDSGKSFFSPQPSLQLQPTLTTTTTAGNNFGVGMNFSGMSKTPASPNKNLTFSLSSLSTSTPLLKAFEAPGISGSKPMSFSTPFKSLAKGVSGDSAKSSQPGLTFASPNLFRSKASSSDSSASETSPQTPGKQLEDNQKPEELKEQKSPKILILQEPLKMMKQMGDEIGKSSFNVNNVDSNQLLKLTKAPLVETSSDPHDTITKKEEESKYSNSTSFVQPESDATGSVGDAPKQPEEGKVFDLSKKSISLPSGSSSPFAINTGNLGLFGLKKVEPPSEKVTSISEVEDLSESSGKHEVSGDKTSMVEAFAADTAMLVLLANTAISSSASGGSGIFAKPSTPTSSPNIATTQSPLFADATSNQCLIGTSSAATLPAFGSVDSAITSATSVFGSSGSLSVFGKAFNATTSTAFGGPTSTTVFGTLATTSAMTFESHASISTAMPDSGTNTTSSSLVLGTTKESTPSHFGSSATISAPIFGSTTTSTPAAFGSATTTPSIFGSTTTSTPSIFGSTTSTQSMFGSTTTTTTSTPSIFGSTTTSTQSMFGSTATTTASATSIFGSVTTTASVFGASAAPVFGTPSNTVPSVFQAADNFSQSTFGSAKPAVAPSVFGSPAPSLFGTNAVSSAAPTVFGAFGAPSSPAQSVFGVNKPVSPFAASSSGPAAGNASSTMFGGSAFGKASSAGQVFGSPSNSIFSQTNTSNSVFGGNSFGQPSTPVFGQGSVFGQASAQSATEPSGGIFGSSASFGGLGGKPSKEKAATNVFGNTSVFGSTTQASSIFGQSQTGSGFGSVKTDATIQGSFTGSNSNVASAGFGGFQKPTAPAFGNTGAFGGTPVFGSLGSNNPTAFGAAPTFGGFGASTMGSPGSTQGRLFGTGSGDNGGFASLANASTPSFEGLIQRSGGSEFGSVAQQGGFGSFGGGEQTSSGFGTTFQAKSPQFTQFRS